MTAPLLTRRDRALYEVWLSWWAVRWFCAAVKPCAARAKHPRTDGKKPPPPRPEG